MTDATLIRYIISLLRLNHLVSINLIVKKPSSTLQTNSPIHCTNIHPNTIWLYFFNLRFIRRIEKKSSSYRLRKSCSYCVTNDVLPNIVHTTFIHRRIHRYAVFINTCALFFDTGTIRTSRIDTALFDTLIYRCTNLFRVARNYFHFQLETCLHDVNEYEIERTLNRCSLERFSW